jgi:acetylornithine deacetylase/succinyl-diaminopimelate desuccinylase-like protein
MRKTSRLFVIVVIVVITIATALFPIAAQAQPGAPSAVTAQVRAYRVQHEAEIVRDFAALLAIPNVATDKPNILRNADRIAALLRARGVEARLLEVTGAPPIVFGELTAPGARHTVIIYAHYDGQPVDESQWASPPWQPRLLQGRLEDGARELPLARLSSPIDPEAYIYARSAGDDKAPIQALLTALDALHASGTALGVNVKLFFEGEEEAGSPHLPAALERHHALLKADAWLLCDGPVHQTRRMMTYFGARGIVDVEMTLYGPSRVLHSGHYGNWAPNSAAQMANLLASMRDTDSHITIPGFYDDVQPLSAAEVRAIRSLPDVDPQLKQELALASTESKGEPLLMAITQPALNVRGIEAGHVGAKAQNAISTEARASIDFRLVPRQSPEKVREKVEAFLRQRGFFLVSQTPTADVRRAHPRVLKLEWGAGYPAARTSLDSPAAQAVVGAIEESLGHPILKLPMQGGSIPMYLFTDVLKTPVIGVPIANHDDNQHAANENLRLQNLWDGIEVFAGILTATDHHWPATNQR